MPITQRTLFQCTAILALLLIAASNYAQSPQFSLTTQEHHHLYSNMPATDAMRQASTGDVYALLELGIRLAAGSGDIPLNQSEAARLYSLASRSGYPGSQSIQDIALHPIRAARPNGNGGGNGGGGGGSNEPLPPLDLVATLSEGTAPLTTTISLDPNWTGKAKLYSWDLNLSDVSNPLLDSIDPVSALDEPSITATFNEPGEFPVRVTVMDQRGRSVIGHTTILVNEPVSVAPTVPVPLYPAEDALLISGSTVDFQWQAQSSDTSYDFYFFDGVTPLTRPFLTGFAAEDICTDEVCTLPLPIDLPIGGSHIWRVRAVKDTIQTDWARTRFSVINAITEAPDAPLLLGPDNAAVIENLSNVTFGWLPSARAQSYDFVLTDAANEPVITKTLSHALCSASACSLNEAIDLPVYESYQWTVVANNVVGETVSDSRTLSVIPRALAAPTIPTNITPANDAEFKQGESVVFTWSHDPETATYEFHFFDQTNGDLTFTRGIDPQQVCADAECSIEQVIDLPVAPLHAWRVRGINSLGTTGWTRNTFSVVPPIDQTPDTPDAITPLANASVEASNTLAFTWAKSSLATSYEFELRQADAILSSNTVAQSACGDTTCSLTLPVAGIDGENVPHTWRVQALNSYGASDWQSIPFLVIPAATDVPLMVTTISPEDGEVLVQGASVAIVWAPVANASSYDMRVDDAISATTVEAIGLNPLVVCTSDVCTRTIPMTVSPGDNHLLSIRAVNSTGSSDWDTTTFKVIASAQPAAPALISPEDGTFFADIAAVDLVWSAVQDATAYDLDFSDASFLALSADVVCITETGEPANECRYRVDLPVLDENQSSIDVFWQVRATSPAGTSDWSTAAFTVVSDDNGTAPMASFVLSNFSGDAQGAAPFTVEADPAASTDDMGIVQYEWNFGDESAPLVRENNTPVSHTYNQTGSFALSLTVTDASGLTSTASKNVTVFDPSNTLSEIDASRFLAQATFGATEQDIQVLRTLGIDAWIEQQFALQGPAHLDYVNTHSNGSNRWPRHEVWWRDVVEGEDQLRQRVAFALSEIFVVSDIGYTLSNSQYGVTHFYDQLRNNAFGSYRELLEDVTKSPIMGLYLSMLQNAKGDPEASTRPDENYAREVLQLFSLGVDELAIDGTPTGQLSFTQQSVEEFARVFTGWNYKDAGRWDRGLSTGQDLISPMEPFEEYHDTGSKTLLGGAINPAGLSASEDLEMALDNIANHPNVGPFISKQLIQRLTTSNPTPAYVARVAAVFNNNGQEQRGDLKAVVKAILMDAEARTQNRPNHFGKLREPVLRLSHLWRAFSVSPGTDNSDRGEYNTPSPSMENLDFSTGQAVLKSASVFNFFQPEFAAIGPVSNNNLVAPEFEIMTESNEIATSNRIGAQINRYFAGTTDAVGTKLSYLNFDTELALADDPNALLDHLDTLLMAGSMSEPLRTTLLNHLSQLPDNPSGHSLRVRDAVTLIMASPDYLIQL